MFISLRELESRNVRFNVDIPAGEIDYEVNITQVSSLHAEGVAELLSHALGEIRVQGNLTVAIHAPCDRCLEPAAVPVDKRFDLVYVPVPEGAVRGEDEVDEKGIEVGYYEGAGLELNDVLREVVLLALPMQLICKDDCKGMCPACGQNRNQVECGCHPSLADDRWSKLKEIRAEAGPRN